MSTLQSIVNVEDPHFYNAQDPFPVYERLRAESPIFWYERDGVGMWVLSKFEDVRTVSTNPPIFSSLGGVLPADPRVIRDTGHFIEEMPEGVDSIMGSDPPIHTMLRKLVSKAFTPRMIARMEVSMREIITESLDLVVPGEPFDFVATLAVPLPMFVIGDMLGVPREDRESFRRWADNSVATGTFDPNDPDLEKKMKEWVAINDEMEQYFATQLANRRVNPRDDLMSGLAHAEIDGEMLSELNQIMLCSVMLAAGNETTRNLISGAALALAQHPEQRRFLAENPDGIRSAVDEFLRWVTPVVTFGRTAQQNTELRGQSINQGDFLLMLYASANRDEEIWQNADVFDVKRPADPMHVAFGWGEHLCVGQNLARQEVRAFFEEFLRRFPRYDVIGEPVRIPSTLINNIQAMDVVVPA